MTFTYADRIPVGGQDYPDQNVTAANERIAREYEARRAARNDPIPALPGSVVAFSYDRAATESMLANGEDAEQNAAVEMTCSTEVSDISLDIWSALNVIDGPENLELDLSFDTDEGSQNRYLVTVLDADGRTAFTLASNPIDDTDLGNDDVGVPYLLSVLERAVSTANAMLTAHRDITGWTP